jgi:hypothetical protein
MNQYEIAIVALLIAQAFTLYLLWASERDGSRWQALWTMTAEELLYWKRNGILRDPLTGKYRKKDKRNG